MEKMTQSYNEFLSSQTYTYKFLSDEFKKDIQLFQSFFDLQQNLFYNHLIGVLDPYYQLQSYERIVIQSYLKSSHLIFTSHELILRGDYGTARILMRQTFEYLVLGKYAQIKKDNNIAEKWLDARQFDVYDKIIRLLKKPNKKNLFEFWKLLSNQAHAKTNSFQISLDIELNIEEIIATYRMNFIFLCCKNNLLKYNFINNRLKYYSKEFGLKECENKIIKQQLKELEKKILTFLADPGIDVINDYKSTWEFKK